MSGERTSLWRPIAISAALITAVSHVPVTEAHLREAPYIGWLFIALEVASAVLAVLMAGSDDRRWYAAAIVIGVSAILAYVVSRSVGLPQISDDIGNWAEPLGIVALVAESVLVLAGAGGLVRRLEVRVAQPVAVGCALLLFALGFVATAYANAHEAAREPMSGAVA